ncbi:MAG: hypothetical protein V4722_27640 [Bacteroidota bacterium]
MKQIFKISAAALISAAVFISCQKQVTEKNAENASDAVPGVPSVNSPTDCANPIANWPASNETGIAFSGGAGTTLEAEQNGTSLTKLVITRAAGFNKIKYRVTYFKADNTGAKVLLYHEDGSSAGGSSTTQNLFTYANPPSTVQVPVVNGANCITSGGGPNAVTTCDVLDNVFPSCWNKCDKIVVEILSMAGAGNPGVQTATYYLRKLTAPAIIITANPDPATAGQPVTVTASIPVTCGTLTLQQWNGTGWDNVANPYTFTPTIVGDCAYKFRAVYAKACACDYDDATSAEFCLKVISTCIGSFGGTSTCSAGSPSARTATYTFKTDATQSGTFKIQGGLTNFVAGADAIVTVTGATGVDVEQVTQGGSSNRRITVNGQVATCSTVTITITWNSNNTNGEATGGWSVVLGGTKIWTAPEMACGESVVGLP